MFSIPEIITLFYPKKPEAELQRLADLCLDPKNEQYAEFYKDTWVKVQVGDLLKEETQLKLVKTLWRAQNTPWGVENEIMRSLQEWSNGALMFPSFPDEAIYFYEHLYCFLGFVHFPYLEFDTQMYLLDSRFLVMASIYEIPLYANVQQYFARLQWLRRTKEDAFLFAGAMARNRTRFGDEGKVIHSVAEWIKIFDDFLGSRVEQRVPEFLESSLEVQRLSPENKKILEKILTLYWGLRGHFIWKEADYHMDAGDADKLKRDNKTQEDYYVELLAEADAKGITMWLESYATVAEWIYLTGQPTTLVRRILQVLTKKVDLKNGQQVDLVLKLLAALADKGIENVDEALYYEEKDKQFHWEKDLLG